MRVFSTRTFLHVQLPCIHTQQIVTNSNNLHVCT
jgi:hypothetical protein